MEEAAATAGGAMAAEGRASVTPAAEPRRLAINYLFLSGGEVTAKCIGRSASSFMSRASPRYNSWRVLRLSGLEAKIWSRSENFRSTDGSVAWMCSFIPVV